jgi:hypothetical protein
MSSHVSVTTFEGGGRLEPGDEHTTSHTSASSASITTGGSTVPAIRTMRARQGRSRAADTPIVRS